MASGDSLFLLATAGSTWLKKALLTVLTEMTEILISVSVGFLLSLLTFLVRRKLAHRTRLKELGISPKLIDKQAVKVLNLLTKGLQDAVLFVSSLDGSGRRGKRLTASRVIEVFSSMVNLKQCAHFLVLLPKVKRRRRIPWFISAIARAVSWERFRRVKRIINKRR